MDRETEETSETEKTRDKGRDKGRQRKQETVGDRGQRETVEGKHEETRGTGRLKGDRGDKGDREDWVNYKV